MNFRESMHEYGDSILFFVFLAAFVILCVFSVNYREDFMKTVDCGEFTSWRISEVPPRCVKELTK